MTPYTGPEPELIQHGGGWGSSYSTGEQGGIVTSSDLHFESLSDSGIEFGKNSNRALRIRNLTLGSAVTFEPESGGSTYQVTEFSLDPETKGVPPSEVRLERGDDADSVALGGTWTGDMDIFRTQAFGMYVAEIVDGSTTVGRTGSQVYGTRYRWGTKQTSDALYVTRQPSTNEEWYVLLVVGENTFEPKARLRGEHLVDDGVFRVELTGLDLDPGQYSWSLVVSNQRPIIRYRAIELTPLSTSLIVQ